MAPRILIFGTGSLGAVYAYLFSRTVPKKHIIAVCRSNYEAVSKNGFTIHSTIYGQDQKVHPVAVRSVEEAVAIDPELGFDYILVTSKALPTTPLTAAIIKPAVSSKTTIVLIQNGIEIEEPYAKLFPDNALLSTVAYVPATQISPGVVQHSELALLHVGSYPASSNTEPATRFAELLKASGGSAVVHEDVQFERWSKLLINASWNPICALSRSRDVELLQSNEEAEEFVLEVFHEIAAVANACGYLGINNELVNFQLARATVRVLPGIEPSMMGDALAGRRMEVDAIVGNVVRLGKKHGVNTPMLKTIYILVGALDQRLAAGS